MKPETVKINADTANVQTLYLDRVTNHGAAETSPAKEAPAPMVTKSAGSAQHNKVPTEVNSDSVGNHVCLVE